MPSILTYFLWHSAAPLWHNGDILDRSDFLYKIHLKRMIVLYVNRNFVTYIMHSTSSKFGANSHVNSCEALQRS